MLRFWSARAAAGAALLSFLVVSSGCAGPRYATSEPAREFAVPTVVSVDATLRRSADPAAELEALPRNGGAPVILRRAFLELQQGHARAAIDATSQVLFGAERPSANDEAYARYLRAKAYSLRGTAELAEFDLERARALALDQNLRGLLDAEAAAPAPRASPMAAVAIEDRERWRAAPPDRRNLDPMDRVTRITIHHSAIYFRDLGAAATAGQLRRIQKEHMQGRGYGDIGYHYLIDPAGRIWEGRDLRFQGAHASGANNIRNVGICLLGNFVRGGQGHTPTAEQVAALTRLVTGLRAEHGVAAAEIHRHSDFRATECPGPLLDPVIARLRRGEPGLGANVAQRE